MANDSVIELQAVAKSYSLEARPAFGSGASSPDTSTGGRSIHALHDVDLRIRRGEMVGVVGRNGAGKSTLLQLVCGVLQPTHAASAACDGRVAALLELGRRLQPRTAPAARTSA